MADFELRGPTGENNIPWVEHGLNNETALAQGRSLGVANITGVCGFLATIATPFVSLYDNFMQGLFSRIDGLFSDVSTPVISAVDDFSSAVSVEGNSFFDAISYAFALDGLQSFFSGAFLDSLLLLSSFVGLFALAYISACILVIAYRLTLRIIKIVSLGFLETC